MNKQKKISIFIIVAIIIVAALIGFNYNHDKGKTRFTASFLDVFDTKTDIVGYSDSKQEFSQQVEKIKEKLVYYNNLYDIYNDYDNINNIKTINDNAGIKPVKVDTQIINLLKYCKDIYQKTDKQVNVAMGSVLSIWHDYREEGSENPDNAKLPPMEELIEASKHTNIDDIIIDEANSTVYLKDPEMSLDVGSIGKGYAVQRVVEYAKEIGITDMLISVGGNVCAIGQKDDGSKWRLGIQNPDLESEETYSKKVEIKDACIVTSGDYQRYYTVDNVKYCHIIDPDTLMPANYFSSVSIITEDSGLADALSTSVYNMPFEEGLEFINNFDGVEAMWIFEDGSIKYSDNFEQYVVE